MTFNFTDPNRFRVTWSNGRRFYVDREPACDIAEPTAEKENLPNCTSIAKVVGSETFFKKVGSSRVPLDALRVADGVNANWDTLATMPADERREVMAMYAPRDLARAADRGSSVHALIEGLLKGQPAGFLEPDAEPYRDVAERIAADFADRITNVEVVAFNRDEEHPYGGTFDALHVGDGRLIDWKTRGPDSSHGCYEKEVAQLGLGALCDYFFDLDETGIPVRRRMPEITEMMVVSIKPDGYEVYPVDVDFADAVARNAIDIHFLKSEAGKLARRGVGDPQPMPAKPVAKILEAFPGAETVELADVVPIREAKPKSQIVGNIQRIEPIAKTTAADPAVYIIDEGPDMPPGTQDRIVAGFDALGITKGSDLMKTWNRWVLEGQRGSRPFRFSGLQTTRRFHIYRSGARALAYATDDDGVRDLIGVVLGEPVQPAVKVGVALGSLTIEEAKRLADVVDALKAGATLTLADDGTPSVA